VIKEHQNHLFQYLQPDKENGQVRAGQGFANGNIIRRPVCWTTRAASFSGSTSSGGEFPAKWRPLQHPPVEHLHGALQRIHRSRCYRLEACSRYRRHLFPQSGKFYKCTEKEIDVIYHYKTYTSCIKGYIEKYGWIGCVLG